MLVMVRNDDDVTSTDDSEREQTDPIAPPEWSLLMGFLFVLDYFHAIALVVKEWKSGKIVLRQYPWRHGNDIG